MSTDSKAPEQTALTDNPTPEKNGHEDGGTSGKKELKSGGTTKETTFKDDPSRTAGIPNWGWLLLFMVLAATPVAVVVKSWVAPPATTQQTQLERPAPPQSQSTADKTPTGTEQRLSALEAKLDELKDAEKRLSVLEARLDDTYSTVEAVGFSAGLFGVLITVITLFFALKESERVKDAMNHVSEMEEEFKAAAGIRDKAAAALRDAQFAVQQAGTAKQAAQEAVKEVDAAQIQVSDVRKTATDAKTRADHAKEQAEVATKLAEGALERSAQASKTANDAQEVANGAQKTANATQDVATDFINKVNKADNDFKKLSEVARTAQTNNDQGGEATARNLTSATPSQA